MSTIHILQIAATMQALNYASNCQFPLKVGQDVMESISQIVRENAPNTVSVKEGFEAFLGLPADHPLKGAYKSELMQATYDNLPKAGFDPTKSYVELVSLAAISIGSE